MRRGGVPVTVGSADLVPELRGGGMAGGVSSGGGDADGGFEKEDGF